MPGTVSEPVPTEHRAGFCVLLGLPNVGKSTLLNRLLGMHLAAVSPRPQTTRNRIVGVLNRAGAQLVLVDTPGMQRGGSPLRRYMHDQARSAVAEGDLVLHLVDVTDERQRAPGHQSGAAAAALEEALALARAAGTPILLALNKIDRLNDKSQLLPILAAYAAADLYQELLPISAEHGDGLDRLADAVASHLPPGPALFPEEMATDRAERFLAAELLREQLFCQLGKEVPYAAAVVVESWQERPHRGDLVIAAVVHVERDSQKPIVIGKGGRRLRQVGEASRAAISELLGCPVHLKLHVKVTRDWSQNQRALRDLGYE
jgi:GTP-binding protein Era